MKGNTPLKLGIIATMEEELQPLFGDANCRPTEHNGVLYQVSGIGKVNATRAVTELYYNGATHILLMGTCADLSPVPTFFLTYIIQQAMQYDYGIKRNNSLGRCRPGDSSVNEAGNLWFKSSRDLYSLARKASLPSVSGGRIATGDQHIASPELAKELRERYRANCADMETGAVAQTCYALGLSWIAIKTVSSGASDTVVSDFKNNLRISGRRNTEEVLKFIGYMKEGLGPQQ